MAGVLDVEDAEHRQARLHNAFQKLNSTTSSNLSFFSAQTSRSKPQFIPPPTELLSRVQAFLPALEASNALLSSQDPTQVDIEHIDSNSGPYIEMNLGLGLFDVRRSTSSFNANMNMNITDAPVFPVSQSPSTESDCSTVSTLTSSSSDDWDSDDSSDAEIITSFKPLRPMRPLPRRALSAQRMQTRPGIVMLGESDCGPRKPEER